MTAADVLDAVLVTLTATGGLTAARARARHPAWAVHTAEDHPAGYRSTTRFVIDRYDSLLP